MPLACPEPSGLISVWRGGKALQHRYDCTRCRIRERRCGGAPHNDLGIDQRPHDVLGVAINYCRLVTRVDRAAAAKVPLSCSLSVVKSGSEGLGDMCSGWCASAIVA